MSKKSISKVQKTIPVSPTASQIINARLKYKLSVEDAAWLIYHRPRGWRYLESGQRTLHPALWHYWRIKAKHRAQKKIAARAPFKVAA